MSNNIRDAIVAVLSKNKIMVSGKLYLSFLLIRYNKEAKHIPTNIAEANINIIIYNYYLKIKKCRKRHL